MKASGCHRQQDRAWGKSRPQRDEWLTQSVFSYRSISSATKENYFGMAWLVLKAC